MEIYFSKPLNWRDYAAGKIGTLVVVGMSLTALPALFMGLVHVMFVPTAAALRETLTLAVPVIGFSFLLVLSISLATLASSALISSSRFAAVTVFMIAIVSITIGGLLAALTQEPNYLTVAFPVALNYLGELIFNEQRYEDPLTISAFWPSVYVAVTCAAAMAVVCLKCRRAEVGQR
jgi:hypothetical protein